MKVTSAIFITLFCIVMNSFSSPALGNTWLVRKDGTGDTDNIYEAIQALSQSGDTILVGPGIWTCYAIELSGKALHFISEMGAQNTIVEYHELFPGYYPHSVFYVLDAGGDCSIIGFTIRGAYGCISEGGGGIYCNNSRIFIKNNIIVNNYCTFGGGISCYGDPAPVIENNLICNNNANQGGGIEVDRCSPIIRNNTIVYNYAGVVGGGISIGFESYPEISNNIIAHNLAYDVGGIFCNSSCGLSYPADMLFTCNDVWSNNPSNYCDSLPDQTGMNGNISADPLFCGVAGSGNFYLQSGSPCAEMNVPALCGGVRMGMYPVNCDVSVEEKSWGKIKSLFK
ncbi:MAG: DUF1565 domain-containing protein [Candidatus Krumholzibacteria bacterium]|nr:DUF1565 domain-containing protein [Candidatus Krumholzibacteria bacterium]